MTVAVNGSASAAETLIEAQNVKKHFRVTRGFVFRKTVGQVRAVDGISFSIPQGETYSLVGESGCGKTTTAKVVLLVEALTSGKLEFQGRDINSFTPDQLIEYRASVQAVFQDPWEFVEPAIEDRVHHRGAVDRASQIHEGRVARADSVFAGRGGIASQPRLPLPPRVQRRTATAHSHRPAPWRCARASSSWTNPYPPSTYPSARR